ncbi:hypothetical protein Bca4012_016698 [Brassica carinata]
MTKKKTIQFLVLSLVHILLCVSLQVGVAEARFRHLGIGAVKWTKKIGMSPSLPCGAPQYYRPGKRCRLVPPRDP